MNMALLLFKLYNDTMQDVMSFYLIGYDRRQYNIQ